MHLNIMPTNSEKSDIEIENTSSFLFLNSSLQLSKVYNINLSITITIMFFSLLSGLLTNLMHWETILDIIISYSSLAFEESWTY